MVAWTEVTSVRQVRRFVVDPVTNGGIALTDWVLQGTGSGSPKSSSMRWLPLAATSGGRGPGLVVSGSENARRSVPFNGCRIRAAPQIRGSEWTHFDCQVNAQPAGKWRR